LAIRLSPFLALFHVILFYLRFIRDQSSAIYPKMAAMTVTKEDVRSSKVNFDSFMEDMEMVVTYVAGDETGAMSHPPTTPSQSSMPFQAETPQILPVQSTFGSSTWGGRSRENSSAPTFHLGAAAIVSSRRTPNTTAILVDLDEIQSTLNASFAEEAFSPTTLLAPVPTLAAPKPVVAPQPTTSLNAEPRVATRASRAAGHSDAPRPIGFPVSIGTRGSNTPPQPSASDPALAIAKNSSNTSTSSSATTTESSSTPTSRPSTPPLGCDGASDGGNSGSRGRARMQSPAPMPVGRSQGFATFEEFLLEPSNTLLKALCTCLQVTEATKTCASVVMVFEAKNRTLGMIQSMIEFEVSLQKTAATLFRNNSLTTHIMTCYTKLVGLPFLKTVVGPVILDAFASIDAGSATFEIDPSKAPSADIKTNIGDLKKLVHSFFDRILNSRAVMPRNFMEICNTLQTSTVDRFPESRYFVIGGFLFLRYICPAVVAPDGYKLFSNTISEKQRRMLVLVSKILQTIANERTFGEKEEYMVCMNQLVNEYQGIVQYFFNQLAKPVMPETPENIPEIDINEGDYQLALQQILSQVKSAKTKLLAHHLITSDPKFLNTMENIDNIGIM
jgi:hypothetical protein